ncbi:MAG: AMP-binding protein, partial [Chloroflexota bacterium]
MTDTLVGQLREHVVVKPEHTVLSFLEDNGTSEKPLTIQSLDQQARTIGAALQHLGATGERVLLVYPPGLDFIAGFFGCLYAGAVAVPAYPPRLNRPMPRIRSIVGNAEPTVVLTTTRIQAGMQKRLSDMPDLASRHWLATDDGLQLANGDSALKGAIAQANADDWMLPTLTGETLAFLQYTS